MGIDLIFGDKDGNGCGDSGFRSLQVISALNSPIALTRTIFGEAQQQLKTETLW